MVFIQNLVWRFTSIHVKSCGLRSQLVNLDNDTVIHCWVPASALTSQDGRVGCKSSSVAAASKKLETKPALMLIHGFAPNALLCWENQVGTLTKEFDVYIPDLLFFGNSTTKLTEKRWTESFQAECLMQMLQLVGVQNQIQLVGTSYGGMVAFRMAEMYPNFVKNVVISSSGVGFMSTSLDELLARSNLSSISELLLPSSVKGMKVFLANVTYKAMWLPNFILHDMLQVLYEENREERKQLLDHMIFGTKDALPLPQLSQKFLIVWGEHDEVFNKNLAYELQKHLGTSRAELVVMKNCGHIPQIENPKEYNRIILNFLKTCPQNSTKD
ncbi:unnamed protein product [Sphagnum troendelagicum]|uniref:AB hydrolase-1 domain-containing protein n=1 Tax=Sphagnum troendelagicum TaxID=128251 RepID=A0ABP0UBQ9_9BRYO